MNKRIIYALIIPLLLILFSLYYLNRFNQKEIKRQFQEITLAEGVTISSLVRVAGSHLAAEGESELNAFLDTLYQNPLVIYIGLFKEEELVVLLSRYEGYFPVTGAGEKLYVLDSPVGKIFNITSEFKYDDSDRYTLHIGFDYESLTAFEKSAARNFRVVAGLFALLSLLMVAVILYFDKKFFRKDLELERERQEKERFQELNLLTAEIAHEIKNPLNSIYLSFNTLEKHLGKDAEAVFYRDAIKDEIKRINHIIRSYSDLSQKIVPRSAPVDPAHLAAELEAVLKNEFSQSGATLEFEVEPGLVFTTDPDLLKQVLLNLFKNSLEAGAKKVELVISREKRGLDIEVRDDGPGMDEETAAQVFKPYVSGKTRGMGLGLHIVVRVLEALGGSIKVASHAPGRTVFKVFLPGE